MDYKDMLLEDAIRTAILAERRVIILQGIIMGMTLVIASLAVMLVLR